MAVKKVTVLGGSGFVGSALVTKLDAAGYQVRVLTRRRDDARHLFLLPHVQVVQCDVQDSHALKNALAGSDAVINLVGILHQQGRQTFESVHHQLPRKLAHLCEELGVSRLLHMSALQAGKYAPSQYLRSKAAGEEAINEYSKKLDITIFRPSVIFGHGDSFLNLFSKLVRWLPVVALIRPQAKFQPIWVEDVAQAFMNALENTATYGNTYELGGPTVYTLRELLQKVMDVLGKRRCVVGLNDTLSYAQAFVMELLPIKLMSRDNVRSTMIDSVLAAPMAPELGIKPTPLESVIPQYIAHKTPRAVYDQFRSAAGRAINARR